MDYLNLRDDIYQNLIPADEFKKMWIPEIGKTDMIIQHNYAEKLKILT